MGKEVTKVKAGDLAVHAAEMDAWGSEQEVSSKDVLISKILPMQGLSKLVAARQAQFGEYRDSVTGDLLGSIDEPVPFIPFHCEKFWIVTKKEGDKFTFQGREELTRVNENRQWEEVTPEGTFRYDYTFLFYVIFPKDVEEGIPTPYTLQFNRTSVRGGKKLFTQMFIRNKQMSKTPASFVMNLEGSMKENDKGTFVVNDVSVNREATTEEVMAALELYKAVKGGEKKVDHSDMEVKTEEKKENVEF